MNGRSNLGLALGLAVIVLAVALISLLGIQQGVVQAAPPAAPTPVVTGYSNDNVDPPKLFFTASDEITGATNSTAFQLAQAEALDIHLVMLGAAAANTVTVKLQHSNDNANWEDGATVVATSTATVNYLQQFANFGYYTRINVTPTTTDLVTLTHVSAVARR